MTFHSTAIVTVTSDLTGRLYQVLLLLLISHLFQQIASMMVSGTGYTTVDVTTLYTF